MSVNVAVHAETIQDALVVPPAALLPSQGEASIVLVVGADSTAHERRIEVGVCEPDKVQVLAGLASRERVVTVGGYGLQDGAKVRVQSTAGNDQKETTGKQGQHE